MQPIWESSTFTWAEVLLVFSRLMVAVVLGAAVGWERERHHKAAGLRTHILITVSSAAFMVLALELAERTKGDPARVIQGIVMGVGFIGAGVIGRSRERGETEGEVQGLTTASGIWTTTAIGIAVGAGWFVVAVMTTLITLFVTWGLGLLLRKRGAGNENQPRAREDGGTGPPPATDDRAP